MTGDNSRDYGRLGRLGIGTPQANPTVEAEMRRLIPRDVEYFTLRLTSDSADAATRLKDYLLNLPDFLGQRYAGLSMDAFLHGCTGSEYLLPADQCDKAISEAEQVIGTPVITAARALVRWLRENQVQTIAMATPYPDWLYDPACRFWTDAGFRVVGKEQIDIGGEDTYGIYNLQSADGEVALDNLVARGADAILVSGTGMPSLGLLAKARQQGHLIVSSNYALASAGLGLLAQNTTDMEAW
jgi:maleate isomerase